jgi:hypothetical protein
MSPTSTLITTAAQTRTVLSLANAFTATVTREAIETTKSFKSFSSYPTEHTVVREIVGFSVVVEMPLTCDNIYEQSKRYSETTYGDVEPNPDIAGIGV